MATLDESVLEEGRQLVRNRDLQGIRLWQDRHIPAWKKFGLERHFQRAFDLDCNSDFALGLFNRLYSEVDPSVEHARNLLGWLSLASKIAFVVLVIFGMALAIFGIIGEVK
jgi:hypothetical protein